MSGMDTLTISKQQTTAMEAFQNRCQQAIRLAVFSCTVVMAFSLLVTRLSMQAFPLVVAVWIIMAAYPLVLMVLIWARTGLFWHLLNAYAVWIGIIFILLVLLIALLNIVDVLQSDLLAAGKSNYDLLGLVIVLPLFAFAFKSSTRARAELERAQYGDHWLTLGAISFFDVLLLRLPHERA